jgi:hypothetical protein
MYTLVALQGVLYLKTYIKVNNNNFKCELLNENNNIFTKTYHNIATFASMIVMFIIALNKTEEH